MVGSRARFAPFLLACVAVDGPNSPAAEPFHNRVHKVVPAGAVPSAAFPPSWMDTTMKKIEAFGEEVLAKFEKAGKTQA